MRTRTRLLTFSAALVWLAADMGVATHAGQQPPPPALPASSPEAPVAWLISEGPHAIRVLIRDQSTTEDVFRIERRPAGAGAWTLVVDLRLKQLTPDTGFELPYLDQPLNENAEYHYRIRAGRTPQSGGLPIVWSDAVVLSAWTRLDPGPPASQFCDGTTIDTCRASIRLRYGPDLTYYSSYPLDQARLSITRVVLAVHGMGRNAPVTFTNMARAATTADVKASTLIVAPLFDDGHWSDQWKAGGRSFLSNVSSFAAADQLLMAMTDPNVFPNVREVVVAGHSAGGQFTQRYAAMSPIDSDRPGLKYRFVVANPSSYVYLNDQRPNAATADYAYVGFGRPQRCVFYNSYRYGLDDRSGYVGSVTGDQVRAQYLRRYVVYLLGGDDDDLDAANLDHSCEADVQGAHRFARGTFYYRHMMLFFPGNRHRRLVVPGVGHSSSGMFNSANGREAVFF